MDRTKRRSSLVVAVLLTSVAIARAQEQRAKDPANTPTGVQSQLAKNVNGATNAVPAVKAKGSAGNEGKHSDESTNGPNAANTAESNATQFKDRVLNSVPFIEDFPPKPPESEAAPPHFALPVILNPDSPHLDRVVRPEEIPPTPEGYVIGEEDVLTLTVWKEHDLSGTMTVRPDGKITVPLLGEINVVGMKPAQLQKLLEETLKPFVTVPEVSVSVNQINSRKVYLIGQVVREGAMPMNGSVTVLQVLAGAGGLRDFAKRKKIYILRKHGDEEIRFPFDYDAAIRGRNTGQNIRVEPGDTIVVP
jgi:polysaccharide export outer membrane protein